MKRSKQRLYGYKRRYPLRIEILKSDYDTFKVGEIHPAAWHHPGFFVKSSKKKHTALYFFASEVRILTWRERFVNFIKFW